MYFRILTGLMNGQDSADGANFLYTLFETAQKSLLHNPDQNAANNLPLPHRVQVLSSW